MCLADKTYILGLTILFQNNGYSAGGKSATAKQRTTLNSYLCNLKVVLIPAKLNCLKMDSGIGVLSGYIQYSHRGVYNEVDTLDFLIYPMIQHR